MTISVNQATAFLVAMAVSAGSVAQAEQHSQKGAPTDSIVNDVNEFSLALYGQLAQEGKNTFFSPVSISMAFGIATEGAVAETAREMREALRYSLPQEKVAEGFSALMESLNRRQEAGGFQLHTANALWVQQGYPLKDAFFQTATGKYLATVESLDFKTGEQTRQAAADRVNEWVAKQTNDKIQKLIPTSALNDLTRLILTNAVYFKGDWQSPFRESATQPDAFHRLAGKPVKVPVMRQNHSFGYAERGDVQVLEMHYAQSGLAMTILLPKENDGLPSLEKKLNIEYYRELVEQLEYRPVDVSMPRFKMETEYGLEGPMHSLGMKLAFAKNLADFSDIAESDENLFIQSAVHKAYVDVNEQGTEAAAATGLVIQATSEPPPPVRFNADHPFLFVIRDTRTGVILFIGRVMDPS